MNYSYYKKYFIIIFLFVFWLLLPTNKTLAETSCQENTDCPDSCQCIYTNLVSTTGNCMSSINTSTPCSEATISTDTNIDAKIADAANYNCKWTEVVTKSGDSYNPVSSCSSDQKNITINDAIYYCNSTKPVSKNNITYSTDYTCCCTPKNPEIKKTPDLNPLGNLQIKIPGIDELAAKYPVICTSTSGVESCKIPWIAIYIYAIYNYLLAIGGVLAVIALMIGGVIWLVSAGNASRLTQAKSWISGSLTGVLILLTSYILLYQINPDLIGMKYTVLETVEPIVAETEMTDAIDYTGTGLYPPDKWVTISSHSNIIDNSGGKTNPELAQAIIKAADCMKEKGFKIKINSLSRTVTRQKEIYDQNYTHNANQCGTKKADVAQVCCPYPAESKICPHTSGSAVDMWGLNKNGVTDKTAQYQLQNCMFEAGACLLSTECWHFELPVLSKSACKKTNNLSGSYCKNVK
jgi:hypothetical protein